MIHVTRIAAPALAVFVALFGLHFITSTDVASSENAPTEGYRVSTSSNGFSAGTADDPDARARWEFARLRNPATNEIPARMREKELAFAKNLPRRSSSNKAMANAWERMGPFNLGGRTRALAIDVADTDNILAGGVSGGIFRSTDNGLTWSTTFGSSMLHSVTSIAQDTRSGNTDTWYAGSGEARGNSATEFTAFFRGDGLFKSTDGGASWSVIPSTSSGVPQSFDQHWDYVWEVATDPSNLVAAEVYAATSGGIVRSVDGGTSWDGVLGDTLLAANSCRSDVTVSQTGIVYAAGNYGVGPLACDFEGIWRSTNGTTWTDISPAAVVADTLERAELAIDPSDETKIYLLAFTRVQHYLMQYDTGTTSWTDYSSYLPARGGDVGDYSSQGGYDMDVAVHPDDSDILFVGGRNVWRIDLSGTAGTADTWIGGYSHLNTFDRYTGHHPDQHAFVFHPDNPDTLYTGSDGGVHVTLNNLAAGDGSVVWDDLNNGYYTTQFYAVCMNSNPSDPFLGGGMQDNGSWGTTSGISTDPWVEELGGDGIVCQVADDESPATSTSRYFAAQFGEIYRRQYDAANAFVADVRIDPTGATNYLFANPYALNPSDQQMMFLAEGETMWRNSDLDGITLDGSTSTKSTNWTDLLPSITPAIDPDLERITAVAVSSTNDANVLYFGTSSGRLFRIDDAHTATSGVTPTTITGGSFPLGYTSDIAVDPTDSDHVIVVFSNYEVASIWRSTDGGSTWTDVEGNLAGADGPSIRTIAIVPGTITPYYIGGSTGVYSTTAFTGGSTVWTQEGDTEIGNVVVDMIRGRSQDGRLLVGTHGTGVFMNETLLVVNLSEFTAIGSDTGVDFRWTTSSENNNGSFGIEYKTRSEASFRSLADVESVGNSGSKNEYRYSSTDLAPGVYTFRLRMTDLSGGVLYSDEVEASVGIPESYTLSAAYPNPFNPETQFTLLLRDEQQVTIELYDVAGRRVQQLHSGNLSALEQHTFRVDGSALSSGTYFVRVTGTDFVETRKLSLVK